MKIELESYYNQKITKINECIEQIDISLKNIELYKELVELTKEQYVVSFKTKLDLNSIENTYKIEEIEKEIWQLQIIREKMDLFFDTTILFDKK